DHGIRATKALVQRGIDTRLTVVGGGDMESSLKSLTSELGMADRIEFAGLLSEKDKDDRLRRSHLLVHTSLREGWGLNVLEANAVGTPAVVYPVEGLVDATVSGKTGWVVPDETPAAVADQIANILKDPESYRVCRMAAWERSRSFQWDRI